MLIDFKEIKDIIDLLDHRFINDVFKDFGITDQPTAENIAKFISNNIEKNTKGIKCKSVLVCEGYKGEDKASWVNYVA